MVVFLRDFTFGNLGIKIASRLLSSMITVCRQYLGQTFMYNTQAQKPMRFTDYPFVWAGPSGRAV